MKEKFTLIIVDLQNDFCHPEGSLCVKKDSAIINNISNFIKSEINYIEKVIFTVDWHPQNHRSFKEFGGQWPVHCLQHSWGAIIPDEILKLLIEKDVFYEIITKGTDFSLEEYGAFSKVADQVKLFQLPTKNKNFVICGIAGDYCVLETLKNIKEKFSVDISVFMDGIDSIDGGEKIRSYMIENNIREYERS